jgi:DNA-binding response OmpR family regulator
MVGTVLVVDDEQVLRATLARILQRAGCVTIGAPDGVQAMQLLANTTFDLVYLDLYLPDQDGIQVLKDIRQNYPRLPVIMLTGNGSLQSAVEALRLGATDYLLKPFNPSELEALTRHILQEGALERRKEELRQQITALQAELRSLEVGDGKSLAEGRSPAAQGAEILQADGDTGKAGGRFFKVGRLILDLQAQRATFGEQVLDLPPGAFDYLAVLAMHSPQVVDYQTLVTEAQHYQVEASEARELSKWHIHILRQAIEADPQDPRHVLNVRGEGYRLLVD